jgi:hypothetical protein
MLKIAETGRLSSQGVVKLIAFQQQNRGLVPFNRDALIVEKELIVRKIEPGRFINF